MLRVEYDMLTFIHQHPGCSWVDVLNAFNPESRCRITDAVLNCFLNQGMISVAHPGEKPPACHIRLAPSAVQLILLYEDEQRKEAEATALLEQRLQKQRDLEERRITEQRKWERESMVIAARLSLFATICGAILTFFLQHS